MFSKYLWLNYAHFQSINQTFEMRLSGWETLTNAFTRSENCNFFYYKILLRIFQSIGSICKFWQGRKFKAIGRLVVFNWHLVWQRGGSSGPSHSIVRISLTLTTLIILYTHGKVLLNLNNLNKIMYNTSEYDRGAR